MLFRISLVLFFPISLLGQLNEWDTDQDAMPNGWEYNRSLDIENPHDAWSDLDQDGILNIYELLLGSDPTDPDQPIIIHLTSNRDLESELLNSHRGVVLRVKRGSYDLNLVYPENQEAPRLMIEGGWNDDFTQRDLCRFRTVFNGAGQGSIMGFNLNKGNSGALIVDGIDFTGGTLGAINFNGSISKLQLLVANCRFMNNDTHRTGAVIDFQDQNTTLISDLILINTEISGNMGTAIKVKQHSIRTNFKVLHSTVAFNNFASNDDLQNNSGYGVDYTPESDSLMHVQFANSIFWGNRNEDIRIRRGAEKALSIISGHNFYGTILSEGPRFYQLSDYRGDPLLRQNEEGFWMISAQSLAHQSGINIGFSEVDQPDIRTKN